MLRLTPADNTVLAIETLQNALLDKLPKDGVKESAVKKLMEIFKSKSDEASKERQSQRAQKEKERMAKVHKATKARVASEVNTAEPSD